MINKQCNTGDPLETPGGLYRHATWYGLSVSNTDFGLFWDDTAVSRCDTDLRQITDKQCMDSAVQSFQLASACKSFGAGIDGWLSADSGVRVWSETDHNQQQYLFLYIISLLLFIYLGAKLKKIQKKLDRAHPPTPLFFFWKPIIDTARTLITREPSYF